MRKKNIARAGAAFVLLLGLTGTTVFYQGTATASGAENSEKVAAVNDDASDQEKEDSIFAQKETDQKPNTSDADKEKEADSTSHGARGVARSGGQIQGGLPGQRAGR